MHLNQTRIVTNTLHVFFQVQLTDFENAAYVVFVVLLTRVILSYNIDIRIPISKVRAVHVVVLHIF